MANLLFYIEYMSSYRIRRRILEEEVIEIGKVINYYSKIGVAQVELSLPLSVGDRVLIKGPSTDFEQNVESIQVERKSIQRAEGGTNIGLKLVQFARPNDAVFKKL
jgi:putative protease